MYQYVSNWVLLELGEMLGKREKYLQYWTELSNEWIARGEQIIESQNDLGGKGP